MNLMVQRVDVWAAGIKDGPGGLAKVLDGLREAGADLSFAGRSKAFFNVDG